MKLFSKILMTLVVLPVSMAQADLVLTSIPVTHVYSPKGFDTNDEAQTVVAAYLPNLCYKAPRAVASIEGGKISITMKALFDTSIVYCPQMVVPILEPVPVGVLNEGLYQVEVNKGEASMGFAEMTVAKAASNAVDNFTYANVSSIDRDPGSRKVTLKGALPSDCYEFDRVEYVSNGKDTYSVLPILKKVKADCPKKKVPFSVDTVVPNTLAFEDPLLHIRIMDGKSLNAVFESN